MQVTDLRFINAEDFKTTRYFYLYQIMGRIIVVPQSDSYLIEFLKVSNFKIFNKVKNTIENRQYLLNLLTIGGKSMYYDLYNINNLNSIWNLNAVFTDIYKKDPKITMDLTNPPGTLCYLSGEVFSITKKNKNNLFFTKNYTALIKGDIAYYNTDNKLINFKVKHVPVNNTILFNKSGLYIKGDLRLIIEYSVLQPTAVYRKSQNIQNILKNNIFDICISKSILDNKLYCSYINYIIELVSKYQNTINIIFLE